MNDLSQITKDFMNSISRLKTHEMFPKRMIIDDYKFSYPFDFEVLFSQEFFRAIKSQLSSAVGYFLLVVTDPDPYSYFWENFNWLPVIRIDYQLEFKEYIRLLNADPGGSPADAIIHNSNQVVVADNTFKRVFMFMRDKEIGVGYFTGLDEMDQIKAVQDFGIIDPKKFETIPEFLRAQVQEYGRNHNLI
jgi:hypothetical protein